MPLIRGTATQTLQPTRKQAEHYDTDAAVRTESTGDTLGGGLNVGFIRTGQVLSYCGVNLKGIRRSACGWRRTRSAARSRSARTRPPARCSVSTTVTSTGGFQSYRYFDAPLTGVTDETIKLVLVFRATGTHYIANINFFEFVGDGLQPERTADADAAERRDRQTTSASAPRDVRGDAPPTPTTARCR